MMAVVRFVENKQDMYSNDFTECLSEKCVVANRSTNANDNALNTASSAGFRWADPVVKEQIMIANWCKQVKTYKKLDSCRSLTLQICKRNAKYRKTQFFK